jgi:ADP-heptose:LPS heptosyltransferase
LECSEVRQLFVTDGAIGSGVKQFFSRYAAIYSWCARQQANFVDRLQEAWLGKAKVFSFRPELVTMPQSDYYLSCLNFYVSQMTAPLVELRAEARRRCDSFCHREEIGLEPLLIIAPGSGAKEKNWPAAYYLEVAHWWRGQLGGKVVVIVGPVEDERGGTEELASSCIVARALDLAELAALLARCDVYIGNDSGVSHLAAAVGAPTFAVFGPSDERQWAPRGRTVSLLRHQIACAPCGHTAMKLCQHRRACLTEVSPAEVIHEMRKLLKIGNLTRPRVGITV